MGSAAFSVNEPIVCCFLDLVSVCGDSRISSYRNKTEKYLKKNLKIQQFLAKMGRKTEGLLPIVHQV
jgi:hypothetical protein